MLLRILLVFALAIAAVLLFAATKPPTLRIARSIVIDAPPDAIYPLIADFHQWPLWAPADHEDKSMVRQYAGAASGVGARTSWTGRGPAGTGTAKITAADAPSTVLVVADWKKPFALENQNTFRLEPISGSTATQVTWTFEGANIYPMKVMEVFTSADRMMGRHFELGLRNLKAAAESRAR